jgi:outer membrane murein-binding lipoprotein Lpp
MNRHVRGLIAASAATLVLAGCSSDDGNYAADGETTSTEPTTLSIGQVEAELKQFRPKARNISCNERADSSIDCKATLDGRTVLFQGTPYEGTVGFTVSTGTE